MPATANYKGSVGRVFSRALRGFGSGQGPNAKIPAAVPHTTPAPARTATGVTGRNLVRPQGIREFEDKNEAARRRLSKVEEVETQWSCHFGKGNYCAILGGSG